MIPPVLGHDEGHNPRSWRVQNRKGSSSAGQERDPKISRQSAQEFFIFMSQVWTKDGAATEVKGHQNQDSSSGEQELICV